MPHLPLAKFSSTLIKTLQYNKAYDVRFPISAIVRVDKPNLQVKLNLIDHLRDNSLCIGNYIALVANISRCSPFVELNIQGSNLKTDSTGIIAFSTDQTLTKISMRTGYNCPTRTVYTSNETQVIIDLRKCPPESIRMPHIPYGSSMIAEGTLITSLSGFESGKLGMAVVFAPSSSNIGYYEYQNYPNGPWHKIELKTFPVVKANNDVPALFLNETTRIRFNPANISGSTWTELEARKNASLRAVGWDMSDTKESGMRTVRIGQSAAGYCSDYKRFTCCMSFVLTQMKISGCDKQPGSKMKLNSCGECSSVENDIYKRCNDCHAVIDDCNKCTNGSTGLAKNYMQDCAGQCGEFYTDSCGNCINKANPKNFTDCTGSCNGTAAINKCGHCVGGTTGLPLNHGIDPCGTCKNDSSSCADCAGVPNGGKKRDLCNLCRLPTDAIFNTECRRLGRCNVTVLPNDAQYAIGCNGAGIDVFISVTCKLVSSSQNIDAAEPKLEKFNTKVIGVSLKLPSSVAVGDYKVRCTFPAQDPVPQFTDDSKNSIYIYSKSGITYAERTPVEHEVGFPFDLTITGSGFFNSSYLKCITQDGRHLNATFVSSTTVKCHIPAIRRSINLSLTLSWSPVDRVFNKAKHVNVSLFSYAANITSAKFQDNLGFIDIILDRASKPVDISSTCSSFFSDISTLGTGAICKFSGLRRFTIKLGKQATIKPNDTLIFKSASIKDFHGDVTKYTVATQSVFIASPVNVVYPEAVLTTSSEVANCAGIKLVGRQSSGGGGRPLEFYWSLSVNNDVNSSHPDLVDYRNLLSALPTTARVVTLPKKAGLVNIPITFKLTVKNFLGMQGHDSKIVTRASRIKPSLHVGKTKRTNIISEVLLIGAQATIDASCGVESKILYNWYSINGSTISLPNARNLYLPPRTMKPGLRYQFTVTAALATDPDSTATATITILTVASPLVPRLIMPSSVGINDIVVFDLSKSSDPDQTAETQHCQIEFKIGTASVYRKVDGTFKPVIYTGCIRHKVQINTFLEGDKNYTVVLTYKKGLRVAISSKRLKTEKKSRPLVYLETSSTKKVPTSVLFSIEAKIVAIDFSGDINYYWHCQECAGFDLEASKVKKSETKATKKLKIGATIDATLAIAAFKLPPGATLSFILTACGKVGDSTVCGSAVQNITTSSPPSSCVFAVSPSSGIAFQTLFTFEASYCNDDAPDKPLKYIFGFLDESGKENAINDAGEDSQLSDVRSRSGILTAYVKVMDKNGDSVRLEFTINVSKRAIPPSEVTAQVSIIADTASIDITVAAYQITILIESSDVIADENSEEAEEKRQVQSTALAVVSRNTNGVKTSSQKVIVAISVKSCFKGMTKKNARPEMVKTMSKIFVQFVVTEKKTSRRRRSVTPAPVTPITVSEAETYLEPFRTLDPNKTDNDTLTAKNNFLILLPSLLKGMCRNSLFNVPASVAKTTTAVLQTFKVDFGSTGNSEIQLGCTDCTDMIKNASYLQLGQTLIDQYSSFVCNPNGENCTGACIASAQMPLDYLSTPPVSKRLSAVLLIQFWNPDEMYAAEELTPSALANPMIVKMPLQTTTLATYVVSYCILYYHQVGKSGQCKLWDSASKTWGESGTMTVSQTLITVSNTSYIKCAINQTGYVSIFEGPPLRINNSTTYHAFNSINNNASTAGKPRIKCRFSFALTCSSYFNSSTKDKFEKSVKSECAKKMNLQERALENFQATCGSIIIRFDVVGLASNATLASVIASVHLLKSLIESGSLSIKLYDNRTITASTSGFIIVYPTTTGPPTTAPATTELSTAGPATTAPATTKLSTAGPATTELSTAGPATTIATTKNTTTAPSTALKTTTSSDDIADVNSKEAALTVVSKNTFSMKSSMERTVVANSVQSCFKGMTKKNAPPRMVKTMSKIFLQFVATAMTTSRLKRSVTPAQVTPITGSEAQTYLEPFHTLDPDKTDDDTLTAKNNFLIFLPSLLKGMCRNSLFNVPPSVAKTTTAVLQTFKVDFGSTGNSEIQLGCTDCTSMIKNASYLQLGQTLIDRYSSFVCNPNGKNCAGACIASAQMPLDYLSTPPVSKRLSDVLLIQLWNPDEMYAAEELTPSALANPMIVKMPLQTTTLATYVVSYCILYYHQVGKSGQCKLWDPTTKTWDESGAVTLSQIITLSDTSYIACAIRRTGYVTVFEDYH
eukprot:gene1634-16100_t